MAICNPETKAGKIQNYAKGTEVELSAYAFTLGPTNNRDWLSLLAKKIMALCLPYKGKFQPTSFYHFRTGSKDNQAPLPEPKLMMKKERGSFEVVWADNDICITSWVDKRVVNVASNVYGPYDKDGKMPVKEVYDRKEKKWIEINKPHIVCMYNHGMYGVDLADQYTANCRQDLKSEKPYRR